MYMKERLLIRKKWPKKNLMNKYNYYFLIFDFLKLILFISNS